VIRNYLTIQFLRFFFVGLTAATLNWLARYCLSFWVSFPVAVALAYAIGVGTAFTMNRRYVFPNSKRPIAKQARDFILVNLAFFPIVWIAALLFKRIMIEAELTYFVDEVAHGIAISLPFTITFFIYKFIAFEDK
jgi:putative flippase GtrA